MTAHNRIDNRIIHRIDDLRRTAGYGDLGATAADDDLEPLQRRRVQTSHCETVRTSADGTNPRYVVTDSTKYEARTAGGQPYSYWRTDTSVSFRRTRAGLVTVTEFNPRKHVFFTHHLFSPDNRALSRSTGIFRPIENTDALTDVIGDLPDISTRFPLAQQTDDFGDHDIFGHRVHHLPGALMHAVLDSENWAVAAKKMYGASNYRKPLAAVLPKSSADAHSVLMTFRNLVPIDWIIDCYRGDGLPDGYTNLRTTAPEQAALRKLLTVLDQPARRRILKDLGGDLDAWRLLRDAVTAMSFDRKLTDATITGAPLAGLRRVTDIHDALNTYRYGLMDDGFLTAARKLTRRRAAAGQAFQTHHDQLETIAAYNLGENQQLTWEDYRGLDASEQERVRTIAARHADDLRNVRAQRRQEAEEIEARQRQAEIDERTAEDRAWAEQMAPQVNALTVGDLRFVVAESKTQMITWSQQMHNCIRDYAHSRNRNLYIGVYNSADTLIANIEIMRRRGIRQMLGKYNRDLPIETFTMIVDALGALGISLNEHCWGIPRGYSPAPAAELQPA